MTGTFESACLGRIHQTHMAAHYTHPLPYRTAAPLSLGHFSSIVSTTTLFLTLTFLAFLSRGRRETKNEEQTDLSNYNVRYSNAHANNAAFRIQNQTDMRADENKRRMGPPAEGRKKKTWCPKTSQKRMWSYCTKQPIHCLSSVRFFDD